VKNLYFLLPIAAILLVSSCKKDSPVITKTPDVAVVKRLNTDSVSFIVNGKLYTNSSDYGYFSREYGNSGTNLKLSSSPGDWYISGGKKDTYWVGTADSVQYHSSSLATLKGDDGGIRFAFIKNNKRANMLLRGAFYVPNINENLYTLNDYKYAIDYGREGKDDGVAITFLNAGQIMSSYSPISINAKSTLTAESQKDAKFKITKIEEVKGTDNVIIEATFEANLFDKDEKPTKVTNGFLRLTTLKYGVRF